jgi:O-antigen/teichoic acid export membrane protein
MGSNVAVMAAQAISSLLVARWAGPEKMGAFYSAAIVLSYAPILLLGVNNGLNRELPIAMGAGRREAAQALANAAWWWVRAAGLLVAGPLLAISGVLVVTGRPMLGQAFLAFMLIVPLTYVSQNAEVAFRTGHDFVKLSKLRFVKAALAIGTAPLVWLGGWGGLLGRAVGIQAVYSLLLFRNRRVKPQPVFDRAQLATLVKVGLPIFLVGYIFSLFAVVDRTLILKLLSPKEMGFYTPAILAASALMVVPTSMNMIIYPRMCEVFGRTGTARSLAKLAYLPALGLGLAMLPCYAFAWWFAEPFVLHVLPRYAEGIAAARWMIVAQYFLCFSTPQDIFTTINRLVPLAVAIGIGIAANAMVAVSLVDQGMGLTGIAIGNACGMGTLVIVSGVYSAWYVFRSPGPNSAAAE